MNETITIKKHDNRHKLTNFGMKTAQRLQRRNDYIIKKWL